VPFNSFIDTSRMMRVDRFVLPVLAGDARLMTVNAAGLMYGVYSPRPFFS
jgi:hypothetical protein